MASLQARKHKFTATTKQFSYPCWYAAMYITKVQWFGYLLNIMSIASAHVINQYTLCIELFLVV